MVKKGIQKNFISCENAPHRRNSSGRKMALELDEMEPDELKNRARD